MKQKTWTKKPNKEFIVGPCKWCEKELVNTESFVAFADKSKDAALKRALQKLEHSASDLEQANKEINDQKDLDKKSE